MTIDSEAMSIRMLTTQLGEALVERQWQVVCAESCTGGGVAFELSAVPGCSRWFDRAFVAYSNDAKHETLGVSHRLMIEHGAVSSECVAAMTAGSLKRSSARFAMAASGVAGPGAVVKRSLSVRSGWLGKSVAGLHSHRKFGSLENGMKFAHKPFVLWFKGALEQVKSKSNRKTGVSERLQR